MALGPEIGDAYVEIHADTRGLPGEIRRAAKLAGAEFGGEFAKGLNSQLDSQMSVVGRRFRKSLTQDGKLAGRDFGDAIADEVLHSFDRLDRDLARAVATGDWKDAFANFDLGNLDEAMDHARARLEELKRTSESFGDDDFRSAVASMEEYADSIKEASREADAHKRSLAGLNQELYEQQKRTSEVNIQQERLVDLAHEMNDAFDNQALRDRTDAMDKWKGLLRDTEEVEKDHAELLRRQIDLDHDAALKVRSHGSALQRLTRRMKDYNGQVTIFGGLAGSRNNFLNIIGIAARAAEQGAGKLVDKLAELPEKFVAFAQSVSQNGGGIQGFFQSISTAMQGDWVTLAVKLGIALIAVGSGLQFTITGFGILTSALSGLAAIATSLIGVLAMGLIGGLAILGPLALAAAGGVAAFIVAAKSAGDTLDKALKPLKDWGSEIGDMVAKNLFSNLAKQVEGVKSVLNDFVGPLLMDSATELRGVLDYLVAAFKDPNITNTLAVLGDFLPQILGNLGDALVNFTTGLLGFFAVAAPLAANFASLLSSWTASFSAFTNSPEGQTRLGTFLQTAYDAFLSILDLVGAVTTALLTLFEQVSPTGQTFLDKITAIVNEFTEWANSEEGRQKIATWMSFARDLADALWGAIQVISQTIKDLDSAENRAALLSLIDAFTRFMGLVDKVVLLFRPLGGIVAGFFKTVGDAFDFAADKVQSLMNAIKKVQTMGPLGVVNDLAGRIGSLFGKAANGRVVNGPTTLLTGEAGPEAIVPLNRPLGMVDPSVRALSAIAQGKAPAMGAGGVVGGGLSIASGAIQVITPYANPGLVASSLMDRLVLTAK